MNTIFWIIRLALITVGTILGLRIFTILLQRIPGFFVSLSILAIGVLSVALYKGSFQAVGLKDRRSIRWALAASAVLLIISGAIMLFVDRT